MKVLFLEMEGEMWYAVLFGIFETAAVLFCWDRYKVLDKKAGLIVSVMGLMIFFHVLMLKKEYSILTQINLCSVLVLLCMIAMIDFRIHKIPNRLILIGLIVRTVLLMIDIRKQFMFAFVGLFFGLGIMLLLSVLTRHGIGYGDVKLFGWIGYALGLTDTYNVLFYSVLYAAMAGVYLIKIKKQGRKTKITFAPFVFLGTYSVCVIRFLS